MTACGIGIGSDAANETAGTEPEVIETAQLLLKLGANPKAGSRRPEDLPPSESKLNKPAELR